MNTIANIGVRRFSAHRIASSIAKRQFGSESPLVKTACYDLHVELGGDMVPFAGYELPVLYKGENGGVMKEHLWCREDGKAALFDVSHMGQVCIFILRNILVLFVSHNTFFILHLMLYYYNHLDSMAWKR